MRTERFEVQGAGGMKLPSVLFLPEGEPRRILQIAHGMTEHIGRYEVFAGALTAQGIAVAGYDLPFILLSDPELQAIQAFDVWQEKKLYGKVSMGVVRTTYVIDEAGVIEKVMPKVKPDTNAAEILSYLSEGK